MAIDEHGAPGGDDKGARDEIPGKAALASSGNGVVSDGPGGSGAEAEPGGSGGPGGRGSFSGPGGPGGPLPADGGEPGSPPAGDRGGHGGRVTDGGRVGGSAGTVAGAAERVPDEPGGSAGPGDAEDPEDPDSFEPYLPPAPNPFSSVYPQPAPPYLRPAHDEPAVQGPAGHTGSGSSYAPSRDTRPLGQSGYPEQQSYPVLAPGDPAGGYDAQGMYGAVPAYPSFQPYAYDLDDGAYPQDALEDYGEESLPGGEMPAEERFGYAPAPTAEPLPGISTPGESYPSMAMQDYEAGRSSLSPLARGGSQHGHEDGQEAAPYGRAGGGTAGAGASRGTGAGSRDQVPQGTGAGNGLRGEPLAPLPLTVAGAGQSGGEQARETSDSLTSESLLPGKRTAPASGWRRAVYKATAGMVKVGESAAAQRRRELMWRARTPVAGGHHRVAVMSLKGGVGKTTTTVGLGSTLGMLRGDRVIAIDANPDRGTLSDKVRLETSATVRDLLNEREQIRRYADVRAFTSQALSRLEVLASDRDPAVSIAFSEEDYCEVARVLERFYSICITDCGTGLLHSAMAGVLRLADQVILVSSPSVDGARSASATLDWLEAHDYGDLVRNAVVVLSVVRPRSKSTVDLDRLEQHFATRCRAVVRVPYDSHLEEGAEVELDQLSPAAADAYLALAATVGDGFAWPRRSMHPSS